MTKVKCPNCQFANPPGQDNCVRCRTPLPKVNIQSSDPAAPVSGVTRDIQLRPGQIIANRYTALDIVGRGGMGCIYKVRDNTLGEDVALKMLLPQFAQDKVVVDRFLNEARIARQLSHPNIVRVHDIGIAGKALYISMEFLQGTSLRGIIEGLLPGQRLPLKQVLDIFDQLCSALEYAHQYTVHRDIKPENVMVLPDGAVKLMDFGISKLMSNVQLTSASMVMGTPYYMSPEQLKDSRNVDARADIYSLGVMLYEVLTGNLPTGVPRAASQIRQDLPPILDPVVETCVEPDPDKRYQSIQELRNALLPVKAMVDSETGTTTVSSRIMVRNGGARAIGARRLAGIGLLLVVFALTAGGIWQAERIREQHGLTKTAATPAATARPHAPNPKTDFDALRERVELARAKANAKSPGNALETAILEHAGSGWEAAQQEAGRNDYAQALHDGRWALQCYLGVLLQPGGMVFIPPGKMDLSDPATGATGPIQLDGFWIDQTEVTNQQFADFARDAHWRTPSYFASATPDMASWPVVQVTFYDAEAYAAWAHKSLPTEAQWAMAAYGSSGEPGNYPWGDDPKPGAANVAGDDKSPNHPTPVGSYQDKGQDVTSSGCFDMAGNVSEWTRSEYKPFPYDPTDGREDQFQFGFRTYLTVRGGNYARPAFQLSQRAYFLYGTKDPSIGFRCVRELPSCANLAKVDALLNGL